MKNNFPRQIGAVLAILVALAPVVPLEAAKHRRQRSSKGHISAAKIDAIIAKFTHDELAAFPKGALGANIILSEEQFRGNGLRTALEKAARQTRNAIARWPQAARLPEAMAHLPNQIPGLAITKHKQQDGSSYFAGTFTTPQGCVFCWTRTVVFIKDPWYVVRFTIEKCDDCPKPPTPTPTPPPPSPTPTPTPHTPTPTPTPHSAQAQCSAHSANPDHDADATDANSDADSTYANADTDSTYANADTDSASSETYPYADTRSNSNANTHSDSNGNRYLYSYCDS